MSKVDEIKENIGWLKVIFGLLAAIDVSLLGWLAQNYNTASEIILGTAFIIIIILTVGVAVVNRKAYQKIRELGDL
ncbi:MAG: hypothetical protein PHV62_07840 [Sulfuricurvum sp.]|nr:hypothetical protein [Sulfuricurvum sp.]